MQKVSMSLFKVCPNLNCTPASFSSCTSTCWCVHLQVGVKMHHHWKTCTAYHYPHKGLAQKARKFSARNICPNLGSRRKTDLETQRIEKKAFRARADLAQSARQGGIEPGTTRFKNGRATTGPPAPRRALARPRFSRGQEGLT